MDRIVKVSRSFLNRIRGFVNMFASQCSGCMRRSADACSECTTVNRAKILMIEIDTLRGAEEERFFVENPTIEQKSRMIRAVEQAGRPLLAREIRLDGVSKQRKNQLIMSLVDGGYLVRMRDGRGNSTYGLGEKRYFRTATPSTTTQNTNER